METSEYLEQLLLRYEETYDIYKPYYIDGKEYPAYGYFTSDIREQNPEKNGKLWASAGYEHILFLTADKITQEHIYIVFSPLFCFPSIRRIKMP